MEKNFRWQKKMFVLVILMFCWCFVVIFLWCLMFWFFLLTSLIEIQPISLRKKVNLPPNVSAGYLFRKGESADNWKRWQINVPVASNPTTAFLTLTAPFTPRLALACWVFLGGSARLPQSRRIAPTTFQCSPRWKVKCSSRQESLLLMRVVSFDNP